jgi:uncharacterized membrane protein
MKKITLSCVILSFGIVTEAFHHLLNLMEMSGVISESLSAVVGHIFIIIGVIMIAVALNKMIFEIMQEVNVLKNRQEEIRKVIGILRKKYFRKELKEEELRKILVEYQKELAEIEARLEK